MKKLFVSRRQILCAIRAAAVALFLLAAQHRAAAQVTAPFQVSGTTITTTSGSFGNGSGVYEPGTTYTSISISAGTTVTATTPFGGSGNYNTDPFSLVTAGTSTFTNAGSLTLNGTNGSGSGAYQATVFINNGATSVTGTNSGTIVSNLMGGNVHQAIEFVTTTGNITATNSGTLTTLNSNVGYTLETLSTVSGNLIVTNTSTGNISASGGGVDMFGSTAGTGTINVSNAGTLTSSNGDGISFTGVDGTAQASNSGTINAGDSGIYLQTTTGAVTLSNTGTITALYGLYGDSSSGNVTSTNGGLVTSTGNVGIEAYSNTGTATATNNGTITGGTFSGIYASGAVVNISNAGLITNSASAMYAEGGSGATHVSNTGSITSSAYGIKVFPGSGPVMVTNSGYMNVTTSGIVIYGNGNVTNTGTIMNQNTGIQVQGVGTINDSGNIGGGPVSISVQSGGSVILTLHPTITGTMIGGGTSSSTSTLAFDLTVPAAQLAADKAQLNTEIAQYDTQLGGAFTFTIGSGAGMLTYDINNFEYGAGGITDGLLGSGGGGGGGTAHYALISGFRSLGTVLDNLNTNNAQAAAILNALGNVPTAGLPGALEEISPKSLQVFRNVAFDNNTFNDTQINNHLANLRDGQTGFDSSALAVHNSDSDPTLSAISDHLLAYTPTLRPGLLSDTVDPVLGGVDLRGDAKDMKSSQVMTTAPADRWSTFIAGNVILADLSNGLPLQDSNYTTGAVTAGADYRLDDHWTVGALVSYAHTAIDLDDRGSSATVDSYTPGVYASYVDGGWYGNGLATYVRNAYTEDREIDIPGIGGDNHGGTSGNEGTGNLTGGYEFQRGAFKFGPVATVEYVHLDIQSIQEEGPTALDINEQSQDSLRSLLGFEGRFAAEVGGIGGRWLLTPHLSVSWQHEYLDNSDGIVSQFNTAGGGSFSTQTDSPDRDSAFIDAGLDATVNENVTLFIDYATQVGQNDYFGQSAQGGVRVGF